MMLRGHNSIDMYTMLLFHTRISVLLITYSGTFLVNVTFSEILDMNRINKKNPSDIKMPFSAVKVKIIR